jgi:hypothetical protein
MLYAGTTLYFTSETAPSSPGLTRTYSLCWISLRPFIQFFEATTLYMRSWWGFLSEQVMGNEGDGVRFHVVARPYEIGTDGEV